MLLSSVLNILDYRQPHPRVPAAKPFQGFSANRASYGASLERDDSELHKMRQENLDAHDITRPLLPSDPLPFPITIQEGFERLQEALEIVTSSPESHALDLFE